MPYKQSWLDFEERSGGRFVLEKSPENIKVQYEGLVQMLRPLAPRPSENVENEERQIDGVKVRISKPKSASGPLPIAIWTHGGGYMTGDLDTDHILCTVVAENSNSIVVNIDYSLTPEHKWPTQLNECLKVYKWAHDNAASIGGDAAKMWTIGGSAGGALALQICSAVLKDSSLKSSIKGVAAMMPLTVHPDHCPGKYKSMYKAYEENKSGVPIIDRGSMDIFYDHLGGEANDKTLWTLLDTETHKSFPPVYFTSAEFDPLRDDTTVMIKALEEAGVPTRHDYWEGFPHFFFIAPGVPEGAEYVGKLLAGIGWLQSQM